MKPNRLKPYSLLFIFTIFTFCVNAKQNKQLSLTQSGRFVLGCNYWASHAGTNMWKDWRPDVMEADLKQISEAGMQMIRVFPI